jgi:hypothetical protein
MFPLLLVAALRSPGSRSFVCLFFGYSSGGFGSAGDEAELWWRAGGEGEKELRLEEVGEGDTEVGL